MSRRKETVLGLVACMSQRKTQSLSLQYRTRHIGHHVALARSLERTHARSHTRKPRNPHTHSRTHARTHARMHACTHSYTHAGIHTCRRRISKSSAAGPRREALQTQLQGLACTNALAMVSARLLFAVVYGSPERTRSTSFKLQKLRNDRVSRPLGSLSESHRFTSRGAGCVGRAVVYGIT
jgi:hypothetical protein